MRSIGYARRSDSEGVSGEGLLNECVAEATPHPARHSAAKTRVNAL
jgi:hypothetical protein